MFLLTIIIFARKSNLKYFLLGESIFQLSTVLLTKQKSWTVWWNSIGKQTNPDMFTERKEWTFELTSDTFPQQSVSANKLLCRRYPPILLMPWSLAHCILTFYLPPLHSFLSLRACHYQSVITRNFTRNLLFVPNSSGMGVGRRVLNVWLSPLNVKSTGTLS